MRSALFVSLLAGIVCAQEGQEDPYTQTLEHQHKAACLAQCGEMDVDCHAICNKAPHPKAIHMDLMTECVRHCDVLKSDGNAASLKEYGTCHDSCIGGYMNLGNSQAAPTTKTWVDLVTPTTHLEKAASQTAASVSASAGDDHSGHDLAATGSADGNKSAAATPDHALTTISGLVSTRSSTGTAYKPTVSTATLSKTGNSSIFSTGDEKAAQSNASNQIVAAGSLIAAFAIGLILL
ncbi:hypothetical protein BLS_006548 [Venturia inaequalis]|uniref:Uncharacterized protein n=1 Tax=Venturia inaequalis TaxID=5025 RepID=A0A8H3VAS1_VENIN|nr:hypothetical protein BLS_006548 [Venturia inaequalis]KAE9984202.1 hypothetical protein EG327_005218 [Venturia inaequalis]RDI80337.1 hypothetical protein Vi05172_g9715 [Venturia inaequalis]